MASLAVFKDRFPVRLFVCGLALATVCASARAYELPKEPPHSAELDAAIIKQAKRNGVPEKLVRRIVMRESKYNARARNRLYWGLMQISYPTAKSMGFKGTPDELLNPFVNLTYAVPYLANAFIIAGKREDAAVRLYASGYYATAKQRGLLGALRTAETAPVNGQTEAPIAVAAAEPQSIGVFGALFGPGQQQVTAEQQVAAADPQGASMPAGVTLPEGKKAGISVAMSADKTGEPQPPKKWLHDGGVSVVARGEQRIDLVAAHAPDSLDAHHRAAHVQSRKNTTFASLDAPPATAQAYAATLDGQDPRLAQTASQAAIQQATFSQPQSNQPQASQPQASQPEVATADQGAPQTAAPDASAADKPARPAKKRHAKHVKAKKPVETAAAAERPDEPPTPQVQ